MKKAEALNCASTSLSWKMPLTAATKGSISDVIKPHAKKKRSDDGESYGEAIYAALL